MPRSTTEWFRQIACFLVFLLCYQTLQTAPSSMAYAATAVSAPTFSPVAGAYTSAQTVTIGTSTSGASIRYTTNGSTPSETAGTLYSAPVAVSVNTTIKAIAYKTGMADSTVSSAAYTIAVSAPTFSPVAGAYTSAQNVAIATGTSGASIRYTTDGSAPSETAGTLYSTPVAVSVNTTIKAIAYKTGMADSTVSSAVYTIAVAAPTFSPAAGTYSTTQSVAISSTTSGASIRYTTNGSAPSETAGTLYTTPVAVSVNTTIKAIAYKTGMADSAVSSAAYSIAVAAPTFSPGTGTYGSTQNVTIGSTTSGASIRYTTNGSAPSETAGTLYSTPVAVSTTTTIKAIAYKTGMADSTVSSAMYTILTPAATPTFTPAGGNYSSAQTIKIATTTSGASINYTTNGATPTETVGTPYTSPFLLTQTATVQAIAYKTGMADSAVGSVTYTITSPDFTLGAIPSQQQVAQGGTASFTITTTAVNGFSQSVALSAGTPPSGVTIAFSPSAIAGAGGAAMNVSVSGSTAPGSYPLVVTGVGGGLTHTETVTLVVLAPTFYEAEAAVLAGGATKVACSSCSGGYLVENLGYTSSSANGTLTFNNVNAATSGIYALTVYYTNGDITTRTANIGVNGSTSTLSISGNITGSWTTVNTVTVNVTLAAGNNTIEFFNNSAPAPAIDRISLANTESCSATPVDVVLVIDRSGSMGGLPLSGVQTSAPAFVDDLQLSSDQIALVSFNSTATTNQTLTHTGSLVTSAIAALTASGSTAIATGISAAITELASSRHNPAAQKVIVLLSDGFDNPTSGATATTTAANNAKSAGIRIIAIAYGAANTTFMQSLASSSADYYASPTAAQMAAVYNSISVSICRSPNQPPVVNAGPNQTVVLPAAATLTGTVSDDGLPQGNPLTSAWSMVSGPGTVTFANASAPATTATFSTSGTYVLQLSASDGEFTSTSTVTVTVQPTPAAVVTTIAPASGQQGLTLTAVAIAGQYTHFGSSSTVSFGNTGVIASSISVTDATHLTATVTISPTAALGATSVTVTTGSEVATGGSLFTVTAGTAVVTTIAPNSGQQGQTLTAVAITGQYTHFGSTSTVTFGNTGVTASSISVTDATHLTATVAISATAATGTTSVTVTTSAASEAASGNNLFTVTAGTPVVTMIAPASGQQGQTLTAVAITGQYTHFGSTSTVTFGNTGVTASSISVTDATHLTATVTISPTAALGATSVTVTTGSEVATGSNLFTVKLMPPNVYAHRRPITIDHTKVPDTDQANFPVLISGVYPFLAGTANGGQVQSPNGYDIIFTSDFAGTTKLDHEIESYDPVTGTINMWVRVPLLSHSCDTVIYIVYGNGAVLNSQANPTGVWDSSYKGVWHLANGGALSVLDSTTNANNGSVTGSVIATTGEIGGAAGGFNSGSYVGIANRSGLDTLPNTDWTVEAWVNPTAYVNESAILVFNNDGLIETGSGKWGLIHAGNSITSSAPAIAPSAWTHVVAVYSHSSVTGTLYTNGVSSDGALVGDTGYAFQGIYEMGNGWPGHSYQGSLDEVRVSNVARSADWIAAQYANQSSPATFVSFGPEGTIGVNVCPSAVTMPGGQTQQFTAIVTNTGNQAVAWSRAPAGADSIDPASGLYTAPAAVASTATVTVTATSQADATKAGNAAVTLAPAGTGVAPYRPACSSIDPSNPLTTNLVGLFLMNEGSGPTTLNLADGQLANFSGTSLPTWFPSDPSVLFNGGASGNSYLDAGADPIFDQLPIGQMTLVAKVYTPVVAAGGVAEKNDANAADSGFDFGWYGNGALALTVERSVSNLQVQAGAGAVTAGQWMQVAFTWDGTVGAAAAAHLFINGAEQAKAVASDGSGTIGYANATNRPFLIGNSSFYFPGSFNGKMAYLAVYKGRILAPAEMNQLDAAPPISCVEPGTPVTLSAVPASIFPSQTSAITANEFVTWSLTGPGALSTSGPSLRTVYTAPSSFTTQQTVTITATSQADIAKTATVPVALLLIPSLQVALQTDASSYQPGQNVAVTITTQAAPAAGNAASTQIGLTNPDATVTTIAPFPLATGQTNVQQVSWAVPAIPPPAIPPIPPSAGASLFGVNLIVNGDAEANVGSADGNTVIRPITGWTPTSNFTVAQYGEASGACCGYPTLPSSPGPPNRGSNYFAGGPDTAFSQATQDIDVSSVAALIDDGLVPYQFSAYLGGWYDQGDYAVVTADYKNAAGTIISTATLGPVTNIDRNNVTGLLLRSTNGTLPPGTRTATITMAMTRLEGDYDDGIADNLSLVLTGPQGASDNYLAALVSADNQPLNFAVQASWTDVVGNAYGPVSAQAQATEVLPAVSAVLSAASTALSGDTIGYSATFTNLGHATASSLAASITFPDGTVQPLALSSTVLAPQASAQATASFAIPFTQASGDLFSRVSVTWVDSRNSAYGPSLSTVKTSVTSLATLLQGATLTASPNSPGPYITGTAQTFTVVLKNPAGAPVPGIPLAFHATGANVAGAAAVTDSNGSAAFTYAGTQSGADNVQASINLGAGLLTSNGIPVYWVAPLSAISTTPVGGTFFAADASGVFNATAATPVVFAQAFPTIGFHAPSGVVLNNTSGVTGATRPFTDITTDISDNFSGVLPAPRAGVGSLASFQAAFTASLLVTAAGDVTFTVYSDNGFVFGVGNGAVSKGGANVNPPASGMTALAAYPVMGAYNQAAAPPAGSTVTVHFPVPGNYPYELDYATTGAGNLVLSLASSASSGYIVPPAGAVLLTPLILTSQPTGAVQSVTANLTDAAGQPLANRTVVLTVTGANPIVLGIDTYTDANGNFTFIYPGNVGGLDTLQASAALYGNTIPSNATTMQWQGGPQGAQPPRIAVSGPGLITLPNTGTYNATVTDPAAPQGGAIAVNWTQVGGPGTITFNPATGPTTVATFSQPGTYMLQVAASDSLGSNSASVGPITVSSAAGQPVPSGWILSPLDHAQVSGVVPIVLIPGETLTSGTLSYYPASNPAAATILNANVTGSGTLSTPLDTTLLPNGSYGILLSATDSTGKTQNSTLDIVVAGDYKPGRVTTTVTDLVVPAPGLSIPIQRTYDSLVRSTSSDFGYGWTLGVNVQLEVSPSNDVTLTLNGQRRTFYFTPYEPGFDSLPGLFVPNLLGVYFSAYTPEPGMYGTLSVWNGGSAMMGSNTGCVLDWMVKVSNTYFCYANAGTYQPGGYIYTDPYGRQYTIAANGGLQSIKDLAGNTLTVTPNGILASNGLSVPFVRDAQGRITQITDTLGNNYLYSYDANGNLASVTYPGVATPAQYQYDATHLYTSGTNPRGYALPSIVYDANGRLQSVTDALNQTTQYSYNLTTNTTTVTNPDGGIQTTQYDAYGKVLSVTDPLSHTTTNVYDANHNLISTTDPLGHTTSYTYDSNGNELSRTYPNTATSVNTTAFVVYNQYGEPTGTKDELGNVVAYGYDANFNPSLIVDYLNGTQTVRASFVVNPNGTMQAGAIGYDITASAGNLTQYATQYTYDANGNMASKTDALGRQTLYTYDSGGHKLTQTDPSTATTTFQYDALGNLTGTTAPLGRATSSQYDGNGNKTSDTDPNGQTTTYQYDALNRLWVTTYPTVPPTTSTLTYDFRNNVVNAADPAGNVTHNDYDLAGRLIATTKAHGTAGASKTTYTYYADGTKQTQTDPAGNTTIYTYDAAGRLITVTDAASNQTQYGYDDAGNQISITDAKGHTTQFQYDCRRRLTKTIYPDSTYSTNTYDGPGNLTGVTDQAGNTVQYTFDVANQLKSVIQVNHPDPAHNTTAYGYDSNGNLTASTDANGHNTATVFNVLNELTSTTLPDGALTEGRTYDLAGNLHTLLDFNSKTTTYAYDPLNRLLSRTPDSSLSDPVESFTYTATGKRATMTDASGLTTYAYDDLDRLTSKATQHGTLSYTYDAAGNVASMTSSNPNGISVAYTYDQLNRLVTVVDNHLAAGQNTTTYAYDPASNLATATYPNGQQSTFGYDTLNRLTAMNGYSYQLGPTGNRKQATEPNGRTLNWTYDGIYRLTNEADSKYGQVAYGLDPVGNRLSETSTISGIPSGAWTYDADDRILSTEQYDNNGNTIVSGARTFAYDFENRLKSMNGTAVTLLYDGDGNRVAKTVGAATTQYLIDDLNPTGYAQVVEELVNGAVQRRYTYGLQRISQTQSGTTSYYGYDGLGSVRQLTDPTGAVTDTYDYDAWGNAINVTGSTPNVYLYRGEQYDPDLKLYYLRARYFSPLTGRFLTRDPADGKTVDPRTLHKYLYAGGNPVNAMDPRGRAELIEYSLLEGNYTNVGAYTMGEIAKWIIVTGCRVIVMMKYSVGGGESPLPKPFDWACDAASFIP